MSLLALLILGVCVSRAVISLFGSQVFTTDAFMLFDGAWRLMCGQRPHIDFYSHVGVLTYVPTVVGLWLSGGTAYGFGYSQALVAFVLAAWTFALGRRRLGDLSLFALCLGSVLVAGAPFAIGFAPLNMGPGMVYNRYGYVLLVLVLIEGLGNRSPEDSRFEFWGGISTGAVLAITLFLKITYFIDALIIFAAMLTWRKQTRPRWSGLALSFACITLPVCLYFGFYLVPFFRDMGMIFHGKQIPWRTYLLDNMANDALLVISFTALAWLGLALREDFRSARALLLAGLAVTAAGLLSLFGNHEYTGFPLSPFFMLIVIDLLNRPRLGGTPSFKVVQICVTIFALPFVLSLLIGQSLGVGYGLLDRFWFARTSVPVNSPVLAGFTFTADDANYANLLNDGFALVRANRRPGETVMSLDFCNPFSYGLGLRPAEGGTTVLQYRTTFSDKGHPSPEWLVGSASLVMIPKNYSDGSLAVGIPKLYGSYLGSHFGLVAESERWRLYRNTSNAQGHAM